MERINPLPSTADAVVIGAGLAGLAAAVMIARHGHRTVVLESVSAGGRARTDEQHGFLLNRGPHAVYDSGHAARILRDLGVAFTGHPPASQLRVRIGDDVVLVPSSTTRAMTSRFLTLREKAQVASLFRSLRTDRPVATMSAAAWLTDRGLTGRGLDLVTTLVRVASYSAAVDELSADAAAHQLAQATRGVTYVDGGWRTLVEQLASRARQQAVDIREHTPVVALAETPGGWRVETAQGRLTAGAVVLAAGGPLEAARLIGTDPWGELGAPVTAAVLDLGLAGPPPIPLLFSFDAPLYLSQHAPHARLAPDGRAVMHVMRYGARTAHQDRAELEAHAAVAGIDLAQAEAARFLARMVVAHSQPTATRGGLPGRPDAAVPGIDGVFVAGDWIGPRGLLADAVLASAEDAAGAVAAHLSARTREAQWAAS